MRKTMSVWRIVEDCRKESPVGKVGVEFREGGEFTVFPVETCEVCGEPVKSANGSPWIRASVTFRPEEFAAVGVITEPVGDCAGYDDDHGDAPCEDCYAARQEAKRAKVRQDAADDARAESPAAVWKRLGL